MKKYRTVELFAGIGAPRKALENLNINYQSLGFSEINKHAISAYRNLYNTLNEPNLGDIQEIKYFPKDIDFLFGGFPCQDISRAGKCAGIVKNKTRSGLMFDMMDFIEKTKPKCVITENVKDFLNKRHKEQFNLYISFLENQGYKVSYDVINSKNIGIPQNRNRVFIVAHKKFKFNFNNIKKQQLKQIENYVNFDNTDESTILIEQATKKGYIELKTPGVADLSYPNSKTRRGRVIESGKVVPTLQTTNQIYKFTYNSKKKLEARDCLKLTGFTDEDYNKISKKISDTQIIKLAGNSIVVQVMEEIIKIIINEEEKR